MKHLLEIILENGYQPYRYAITFDRQNSTSKLEVNRILSNKEKYNVVELIKGEYKHIYFQDGYSINDFSSMRVGGLATFFIKDNDFENPIIWGLREANKPPTLINNRPKISLRRFDKDGNVENLNESQDDAMNYCLSKENHENIFNDLFKKELFFTYDLTK